VEFHHSPVLAGVFGNTFSRVASNIASELHIVILNPVSERPAHPWRAATYSELSNFSVVNTENFSLLAGAKAEARNQVHDE
jgi:hypothetical protein